MTFISPTIKNFNGETFIRETLLPTIETTAKKRRVTSEVISSNIARIAATILENKKTPLDPEFSEVLSEVETILMQKSSSSIKDLLKTFFTSVRDESSPTTEELDSQTLTQKRSKPHSSHHQRIKIQPQLIIELQNQKTALFHEKKQLEEEKAKLLPIIEEIHAKIKIIQKQRVRGNRSTQNSNLLLKHRQNLSKQTTRLDAINKQIEAINTNIIGIDRNLALFFSRS